MVFEPKPAARNARVDIAAWLSDFRRKRGRHLNPPQLFALSFLGLIAVGTLGFKVLPGLYVQEELGWIDALFTATSAVCVTGLIVVDTATYFTPAGQAWVLLLIQLGGIGMLTFTSLILISIGQRLSIRQESILMNFAGEFHEIQYGTLLRSVILFTLTIEFFGALLLFLAWLPRYSATEALWHAVFQAISAYCNAGFSTFSDSLIGFQASPLPLMTIAILIIGGGVGFGTLLDLRRNLRARRLLQPYRLSLNSQLVLAISGTLLLIGLVGYLIFEWNGVLADLAPVDRLSNAFFMSVTARTAGFNTIDYALASERANFLTILLMAAGGSPGSMAGGLKTTTVAVIGLAAWSKLRSRSGVHFFGRTIPDENIQRAMGLFVLTFGLMTLFIFVLCSTEFQETAHINFLHYMFEAVSAFNTVGLSLGATPRLSDSGRLVVVLMMFIGRVGPLTVSAALAPAQVERAHYFRYAHEEVSVG